MINFGTALNAVASKLCGVATVVLTNVDIWSSLFVDNILVVSSNSCIRIDAARRKANNCPTDICPKWYFDELKLGRWDFVNECHLTRIFRLVGKRDGVDDVGIVFVVSLSDDEEDDDIEEVERCNGSVLFDNTMESICLSTLLVPRPESFLSADVRIWVNDERLGLLSSIDDIDVAVGERLSVNNGSLW
jgi:hypothetical protein